jgi:hypothetical protein
MAARVCVAHLSISLFYLFIDCVRAAQMEAGARVIKITHESAERHAVTIACLLPRQSCVCVEKRKSLARVRTRPRFKFN